MNDISFWLLLLLNSYMSLKEIQCLIRLNKKWHQLYLSHPMLFRDKFMLRINYTSGDLKWHLSYKRNVIKYAYKSSYLLYCNHLSIAYNPFMDKLNWNVVDFATIIDKLNYVTTIECTTGIGITYNVKDDMLSIFNTKFPKVNRFTIDQCVLITRITHLHIDSMELYTFHHRIKENIIQLKQLQSFTLLEDYRRHSIVWSEVAVIFALVANQLIEINLEHKALDWVSLRSFEKTDMSIVLDQIKQMKSLQVLKIDLLEFEDAEFHYLFQTAILPSTLHTLKLQPFCDFGITHTFPQIKTYYDLYREGRNDLHIGYDNITRLFPCIEHFRSDTGICIHWRHTQTICEFIHQLPCLKDIYLDFDYVITYRTNCILPVKEFLQIINSYPQP